MKKVQEAQETKMTQKIKLNEYHTFEYLKKKSKENDAIYVLPNGKEVEISGE